MAVKSELWEYFMSHTNSRRSLKGSVQSFIGFTCNVDDELCNIILRRVRDSELSFNEAVRACFDANYLTFIKSNQRVTEELREAIHEVNDGSMEWRILNKIIDHALGSTTLLLLSTRKEKFDMYWEFFKENPCFFMPKRTTTLE